MVTTLREGKAKLSELVDRASRGEDVLITVHGKVKARITSPLQPAMSAKEKAQWLQELKVLRETGAARKKPRLTVEQILEEDRR